MNKKLIAALAATTMVGAVGFASVASADTTFYGRVIAGADYQDLDNGTEESWDFGATGRDGGNGQQSRIGVKGSYDLGNGFESGFRVEKGWDASALNGRHQLVYLKGAAGTLTLGQQNNPYINAANWDQTWYLGGNAHLTPGLTTDYREEGISYSGGSGPFSFALMFTGDGDGEDDADKVIGSASYDFGPLTLNVGFQNNSADGADAVTLDTLSVADLADYNDEILLINRRTDVLKATVTTASTSNATDATDDAATFAEVAVIDQAQEDAIEALDAATFSDATQTYDLAAVSVNGSVGALDWYLAYQKSSADAGQGATEDDIDTIGAFVSLDVSDSDRIYVAHEKVGYDEDSNKDFTATVLGYSHSFGPSTTFIGEYRTRNNENDAVGDPSRLALTVKVDF